MSEQETVITKTSSTSTNKIVIGLVVTLLVLGIITAILWYTGILQCIGKKCQNNGKCKKGLCICAANYEGKNCQTLNKCQSVTCKNGGVCNAQDGVCDCSATEYSGTDCSTAVYPTDWIACWETHDSQLPNGSIWIGVLDAKVLGGLPKNISWPIAKEKIKTLEKWSPTYTSIALTAGENSNGDIIYVVGFSGAVPPVLSGEDKKLTPAKSNVRCNLPFASSSGTFGCKPDSKVPGCIGNTTWVIYKV